MQVKKNKNHHPFIFSTNLLQLRIESNNFLKIVLFVKKLTTRKLKKHYFFTNLKKKNHHLAKNNQNKKP